jgi:hypothetical protein
MSAVVTVFGEVFPIIAVTLGLLKRLVVTLAFQCSIETSTRFA